MGRAGDGCPCGAAFAESKCNNYVDSSHMVVETVGGRADWVRAMHKNANLNMVHGWLADHPYVPG